MENANNDHSCAVEAVEDQVISDRMGAETGAEVFARATYPRPARQQRKAVSDSRYGMIGDSLAAFAVHVFPV
jgi:hypothetical protein